jgi:hypothetical protein
MIFVRARTLDDPEVAKPTVTIWTLQAPSWACFNGEMPKKSIGNRGRRREFFAIDPR